jgi:hypothetical protein
MCQSRPKCAAAKILGYSISSWSIELARMLLVVLRIRATDVTEIRILRINLV